jgi:hypothetical protein
MATTSRAGVGRGIRSVAPRGTHLLTISAIEGSTLAAPGAQLYLIYADRTREELKFCGWQADWRWLLLPIDLEGASRARPPPPPFM